MVTIRQDSKRRVRRKRRCYWSPLSLQLATAFVARRTSVLAMSMAVADGVEQRESPVRCFARPREPILQRANLRTNGYTTDDRRKNEGIKPTTTAITTASLVTKRKQTKTSRRKHRPVPPVRCGSPQKRRTDSSVLFFFASAAAAAARFGWMKRLFSLKANNASRSACRLHPSLTRLYVAVFGVYPFAF